MQNNSEMFASLRDILCGKAPTAVFQPIIAINTGAIIGYEGLIRGPSDSALHAPLSLFKVARQCGFALEIEQICREVTLQRFVELSLPGKLFLNVSPECLTHPITGNDDTIGFMQRIGLNPERVIIELTESQPTYDYAVLREAVLHYRAVGFEIAIDDLGEGFSSLRLWSELRPEYVKIDMHFIQGINLDPVKLHFVQSIQSIAENSGSRVIAEGIETKGELMVLRDIGIPFGQGFLIARPNAAPARVISLEATKTLERPDITVYPRKIDLTTRVLAKKLAKEVAAVSPSTLNEEIYQLLENDPSLAAIPVVNEGIPVGLINRYMLIDGFARPYHRELFGRKSCTTFMNPTPLLVDKELSIQDLSHLIVEEGRHYLADGFIITDGGHYMGYGTGQDLMREITQLQISAARYANPLTMLPGNVPIYEHIDRLLQRKTKFCACYCDLDHFKPFNDAYGYRKGDDVIQLTAQILSEICDPELDFIGHIGGDDFVCLFQSADWEQRCRLALDKFEKSIPVHLKPNHVMDGGYTSLNRQGQSVFHPLVSLSIGAVMIEPGVVSSHQEISIMTTDAKKQAKNLLGNSLFIERRNYLKENPAPILIDD